MEQTKVVIASILKPVDDTRMLEKLGLSLAETNKYDINIIGFDSKNTRSLENITYHPLGNYSRTSLERIFKPSKVFRNYVKVKPKVIISNTHELLIVTFIYKILFGCIFIYDVRENYQKNILQTKVFSSSAKPFIASWVRFKEWLTKPFVNHYILAEKIYSKQLPFIGKKFTVIENKYAPQANERTAYRNPNPEHIDLAFTGTIAEVNGVFDAIEITKALHGVDKSVRLRIVGYCALKRDLERLKDAIAGIDYIELNGGDHLVPHTEIIEAIEKADFGFVLKKPDHGRNEEKMLTRLFEYSANKLPMLILNNPTWISYCEQFNAAIVVNPDSFDPEACLKSMKTNVFYDKGDTSISLWGTEKEIFTSVIESLL